MPGPYIGFYVAAHEDDWQFFRGEQAYADLNAANVRIVFIHTTAGDAGRTDGWWEVRERGAIASIRAAVPAAPLKFDVRTVNGHPISVYVCGNSTSYFLRLPDGYGQQNLPTLNSLTHLRDGVVSSIAAVDHSTSYAGWSDFWNTLKGILQTETAASSSVNPWVNAPDYNTVRNPNDHADHKATADALRMFVSSSYNRAWWVGYDIQNRPVNLSGTPYNQKKSLVDAYSNMVLQLTTQNGAPSQADPAEWAAFGPHSYVTIRSYGMVDD